MDCADRCAASQQSVEERQRESERKSAIEGMYVYVCEIQGITNTKQTEKRKKKSALQWHTKKASWGRDHRQHIAKIGSRGKGYSTVGVVVAGEVVGVVDNWPGADAC